MARALITTARNTATNRTQLGGSTYGTPKGLLLAITEQVTTGGGTRQNATNRTLIT